MSLMMLEAPPAKKGRRARKKLRRIEGHVERVQLRGRFLQLRFGKEPGEYVILHVPLECRIEKSGESIPLRDVQFCDSVSVSYHLHHRFDVQLARGIEIQ